MEGYNIYFTHDGKRFIGVTQDDLSISAKIKESITKDDQGETQRAVTGHDVTITVAGVIRLSSEASVSNRLDRDDIIEMALEKGANAIVPVVYVATGGDSYEGDAVITGYSESSPADGSSDPSYSLNMQISGDFTKVSSGSGNL